MLDGAFDTAAGLVVLGGPVVAILIGLSVLALALIIMKLFQFTALRVGARRNAAAAAGAWLRGDHEEALRMVVHDPSATASVLAVMFDLINDRSVPKQLVEDEAGRFAQERLHELQRGFRALEAIVQIAPLLGLFGTVLGMIEAFRTLQEAGNAVDPSVLAGGIWVALLTTAVGLAVAMPVSLVLTWFESRVEGERINMESISTMLLSARELDNLPQDDDPEAQVVRLKERVGHAH